MSNTFLRSLLSLWRGNAVILAAPSGTTDGDGNAEVAPVSAENPLPVALTGGIFPVITATYAPQSLSVGAGQAQLTVP